MILKFNKLRYMTKAYSTGQLSAAKISLPFFPDFPSMDGKSCDNNLTFLNINLH